MMAGMLLFIVSALSICRPAALFKGVERFINFAKICWICQPSRSDWLNNKVLVYTLTTQLGQ